MRSYLCRESNSFPGDPSHLRNISHDHPYLGVHIFIWNKISIVREKGREIGMWRWLAASATLLFLFFKILFIYFSREGKGGRKRGRET